MNNNKKEFHPVAHVLAVIAVSILLLILFAVVVASFSGIAWVVLVSMVGINISYRAVMGVTLIICLILVLIRFLLK